VVGSISLRRPVDCTDRLSSIPEGRTRPPGANRYNPCSPTERWKQSRSYAGCRQAARRLHRRPGPSQQT